ncbi:LysR family transcriptional regulator [Streptomyces sp. NPDC050287]|uniref:LysR family transcriptional regulator n=1 Tax=Streptomyces sp. NPDC050287 TaxID=3365608 RepID=UPI00378EB394
MGLSPSTLTLQIQYLERDLQGQLLIRRQCGHRIRLTDLGKKIPAAAQPFRSARRPQRSVQGHGQSSTGRLRWPATGCA